MILSRTPFRVSLFGGGTDYPAWYRSEGGAVLSTTIDKYCYVTCRHLPRFFDFRHRIVWSHIETVSSINEILHPAVRAGLEMLGFDDTDGVEIHHQGDLPARTGIGSSAAFAVGLINALLALKGERIERHALALRAIELEQDRLAENVGSQDQVASAYGGLNVIHFETSGQIRVEPIGLAPDRAEALQARLVLVYTGLSSRLSSDVAGSVLAELDAHKHELRTMRAMVDEGLAVLRGGDLDALGKLLHESWMLKRKLGERVSNERIDSIYDTALRNGAVGGKLLGAGASGFLLFYVPPERRARLLESLWQLPHVPFALETTGSNVVYDTPDFPS